MKPGQDEKRRDRVCWNKDANAQSLRVELTDESFYTFPYSRLQFVRFEPGTDQDKLHLLLDSHEIHATGKNLRDLGIAFQKLAVEWMKEAPARYVATANGENAYISSIKVNEIQG